MRDLQKIILRAKDSEVHRDALAILSHSARLATRRQVDIWRYAISFSDLLRYGLSRPQICTWLTNGILLCRPASRRNRTRGWKLNNQSRFILSNMSLEFLQKCRTKQNHTQMPRWDRNARRLLLQGVVVKSFRQPATNQVCVLDAFQNQGWPERIDDPLPHNGEVPAKIRLHETIKGLNANQHVKLVQFGGDGTGCGVMWRRIRS